jgi:hypothetical protein
VRPALVDTDDLRRIKAGRFLPPRGAGGFVALAGDHGLFVSGQPRRAEARDIVAGLRRPPRRFPPRAVLGQRRLRMVLNLGSQHGKLEGGDAPGPSRADARCHAAALPLPPSPALDGGRPDAEEAGGLGLAEPGVDGAQPPLAEVDRLRLHSRQHR